MGKTKLKDSELLINDNGSIYHLGLSPEQISEKIIVVGDPDRVHRISKYFDEIDTKVVNREFCTHTGSYMGSRISVISTGIGTDNMDIVLNELDALVNIDLKRHKLYTDRKELTIVRLGTSGTTQEDIQPGEFVATSHALGLDGLKYYYAFEPNKEDTILANAITNHLNWDVRLAQPYIVRADSSLLTAIGHDMIQGITMTATGFYGPQGRQLALQIQKKDLIEDLQSFQRSGLRITNIEMESSALYLMSELLGHKACTVCAVLANRVTGAFERQHDKTMDRLIQTVLERLNKIT